MSVGQKLDNILICQAEMQKHQAIMCNDLKHIIKDNEEFKIGYGKFKEDYYKTKEDVKKITFLGKILVGIYGAFIALIGIFYSK